MAESRSSNEVAVLVSGGVDSAVLTAELIGKFGRVHPIYLRFGLRWEAAELLSLRSFLEQIAHKHLAPLVVLDEPVREIYGDHWSLSGPGVPKHNEADDTVYLPGRNLLLIAKASVWCQLRSVGTIAMGTLASNTFADSSSEFFRSMERTLDHGLPGRVRLIRPYERLTKQEVMHRASGLPIRLTFSCLDPVGRIHCGVCNKCAERQRAFQSIDQSDPTPYAGTMTAAR